MEEEQYIILSSDDGFWSGSKWVKEYPDAMIYNSYTKAEKAFTKLESDFRWQSIDDLMLIILCLLRDLQDELIHHRENL